MKGKVLLAAAGAVLGLSLVLAGMTSGAGAAASARGKPAISPPTHAVVANRTPSPAAARRLALLRTADLSTNAGAARYLRSVGLDPRQVVIQRGTRNYAGPKCPGKKWTCTTSRRVLQMGAINTYFCAPRTSGSSPNDCTIMQYGGGTATCSETSTASGITQNCSITQLNTTTSANNNALVVQILTQSGAQGGTQAATQNASITQNNTKGGSNNAVVTQNVVQLLGRGAAALNDDPNNADDFTPATASAIVQQQDAHQRLYVKQDTSNVGTAQAGNNAAAILQTQLQRARADHASKITQLQNTLDADGSGNCPVVNAVLDDPFANQCNTVQQGSTGAGGKNTVQMRQDYRQFQAASNCCAAALGKQAQGSLTVTEPKRGGLDHRFSQSSSGLSSQTSNQVERQIQLRTAIGAAGVSAESHGPVRKGSGSQTGNPGDTAKQTQDSRQVSTPAAGAVLTNVVSDQCSSQGNCTGTQHVDSNGTVKDNSQSGSSITITVTCAGNECGSSTGPPPVTIAGGTWNDSNGEGGSNVIGTAFLFDPTPGGDALSSLTITGPSGWNANSPLGLTFYHPPGMGTDRDMDWRAIAPVSGTYQAVGVGIANHTGSVVIDPSSTLPPPQITDSSEDFGLGDVSVTWTDPVGATSYLVRVSENPFPGFVTGEQVVPSGTTSFTLHGLDLTPGQEYQLTIFAFSSDIFSGAITSPFNMSTDDTFFTPPAIG
jgi:hypothetical protein